MDAFELKHAGSTIAAELPGMVAARRKAQETQHARATGRRHHPRQETVEDECARRELLATVRSVSKQAVEAIMGMPDSAEAGQK
jgi:hypothetical protein